MPLINIKTNLKSLKFGRDRRGGGSSNQPYVQSSIDQKPGNTGGTDFVLRANTLKRIGKDEKRLSKFLLGSQEGFNFSLKQNLLSRIGVKTQASGFINEGIYIPTSTLAQIAVNPFGGHLTKNGLNPFINTQVIQNSTGNKLLDRALGFNPLGIPTYVKNIQEIKGDEFGKGNRLIELIEKKLYTTSNENNFGGVFGSTIFSSLNPFKNSIKDITNELFKNTSGISPYKQEILRYGGGPGSILGVGQTSIKRYSNILLKGSDPSKYYYTLDIGEGFPKTNTGITTVGDFRENLIKKIELSPDRGRRGIMSKSINYGTKNIEKRINLGSPGKRFKDTLDYQKGLGEALDKLNALPIYKKSEVTKNSLINDLIKFRIGIIDNDDPTLKTYIHFRAFIDSFEDNYTSDWEGEKYMGRGENLYRYKGFDRNISLSWTIAAQSKEELIPMYQKLNYLASTLAPSYSGVGYMRGNLITLTIGDYLNEQIGILKSITFNIPEESPWEIGINSTDGELDETTKQLPHIIKVTGFSFIPIHDFVPAIQDNTFDNGELQSYGNERFISLRNDKEESGYNIVNGFNPNDLEFNKINLSSPDSFMNFDESKKLNEALGRLV